jgi:predicted lipase
MRSGSRNLQSIGYRLAFPSGPPPPLDDPGLGLLLACFSQVAYTPTSRYEVDHCRNAKVVPSTFFQDAVRLGRGIDVAALVREIFPEADPRMEIVATDYSVTFLVRLAKVIVIASRGTVLFYDGQRPFLYDVDVDVLAFRSKYSISYLNVWKFHRGFYLESLRTIDLIRAAYERLGGADTIYFTGHSLGGALSAVIDRLWSLRWPRDQRHTVVFGCPRFGDAAAVDALPLLAYRRQRDPVTHLPPKILGYATPTCNCDLEGPDRHPLVFLWRNHSMERYRRSVAVRYDADFDDAAFYADLERRLVPLPRS